MDGESKHGVTRESVREAVFVFVSSYIEQHSAAPNLGIVNRRFGKQCRTRFSCSLQELLASDLRFSFNTLESGKTIVGAFPPE